MKLHLDHISMYFSATALQCFCNVNLFFRCLKLSKKAEFSMLKSGKLHFPATDNAGCLKEANILG